MQFILYAIGSPYVHEVVETLKRLNITDLGFVNNMPGSESPRGLAPILAPHDIAQEYLAAPVTIPLITPGHRSAVEKEAKALGLTKFPSVIDPTAVIANTAQFGEGVSINAGVVVASNSSFGKFVLINRSASIGHDALVKDYVSFGPGAIVCGNCRIGAGSFIGAGAVIGPEVSIGKNTVIGLGAVVLKDVGDHCLVMGNPAKTVRKDIAGFNDVSV